MAVVDVKGNLNKFYDQAREDVASLIQGAKVGSAVIFNDTGDPVTFYAYNYADTVYLVSAQHTLVAPGKAGTVIASGVAFKVHPNDNKAHEFTVSPNTAYVYHGPGDVETVK